MNYQEIKEIYINNKKEELYYIEYVIELSRTKLLSELEKLEIYRKLKKHELKLNKIIIELFKAVKIEKNYMIEDCDDTIIEFDISDDFISSLISCKDYNKNNMLNILRIDRTRLKYVLTLQDLWYCNNNGYNQIELDSILNYQILFEQPIYVFNHFYDSSEDSCGPCFGEENDYIFAIYREMFKKNNVAEVCKRDMNSFEKNKDIIRCKENVYYQEVEKTFKEELLNIRNISLNECIKNTQIRIDELSYFRSKEYKEKKLLERINKLYKKVKGKKIKTELLFSGSFLEVIKETYKLPNGYIIEKEKIKKNKGKNSVIVIAIDQDGKYIITFQNRIHEKIIAEFPSGYIENDEDILDAASRELKEETGFVSDELFVLDEAYTSPGTDNSKTYIVIASNCIKSTEPNQNRNEHLSYGLFFEKELDYLISNNIMTGATNKLAYYNLKHNTDDCKVTYSQCNKVIYKRPIEKK